MCELRGSKPPKPGKIAMRLICYPTSGPPPKIVPAATERDWMTRTPNSFAYRCLPLNIANAHGWWILNAAPFTATWDGGDGLDAIKITPADVQPDRPPALSHFGSGVLTILVNGLFRTEPGYDLWITGPTNRPKDAIQPLTGVVETDWSPFSFTLNWKFTRAGAPVTFDRDEPVAMIFPVVRGLVEATEPEFRSMERDPEVHEAYTEWAESRRQFNDELKVEGSDAQRKKWQKDYFQGASDRWGVAPADHRTKLRPKPFTGP